jgi:hypothetical protein
MKRTRENVFFYVEIRIDITRRLNKMTRICTELTLHY